MDTLEDRTKQIGLRIKQTEFDALTSLAREGNHPSICAAIRAALPEVFHGEIAREGRRPGFSPKRKTG